MKIKLTAEMRMRLACAEELDITDIVAPIIAERDALSQKLRAAQHEAEALAATVDVLRAALDECAEEFELNGEHDNRVYTLVKVALAATPQQHLRDVRAEAASKAYRHCLNHYSDIQPSKFTAICDGYIEQIKG